MFLPEKLTEIVKNSGLPYRENHNSYIFNCPRCSKSAKLYIRKKDGVFTCFYCSSVDKFGGSAEYALHELLNEGIPSLKSQLYDNYDLDKVQQTLYLNIKLKDFFDEQIDIVPEHIVDQSIVEWPLGVYPIDHEFSKKGQEYLSGRGVPLNIAMKYNVTYSPSLRQLYFPITMDNKFIGWQTRVIYDTSYIDEKTGKIKKKAKSKNSDGLLKDQAFFGYDNVKEGEYIVITEGPVDMIKADLCGNNLATLGKYISNKQIQLIKEKRPKRIYFGLDPDATSEMPRLLEAFNDFDCFYITIPDKYKDLGEMSFEEVFECFKAAVKVNTGSVFVYLHKGQELL